MPYRLRKAPKRDLYWVVGEDGSHKSKDPIPLERAKAQMRALYAAENREMKGGADATAADAAPAPPPSFADYLKQSGFQDYTNPAVVQTGKSSWKETALPNDQLAFDTNRYNELMAAAMPRDAYEAKRLKYPALRMKPYDEYYADLQATAKARSTINTSNQSRVDAEKANLAKKNLLYTDYIKQFPDQQEVLCDLDENLQQNKSKTTQGECAKRHELYRQKKFEEDPFGKVIKGLTTVGDVLTSVVPMPAPVKEGWKMAKDMAGVKGYGKMSAGMLLSHIHPHLEIGGMMAKKKLQKKNAKLTLKERLM